MNKSRSDIKIRLHTKIMLMMILFIGLAGIGYFLRKTIFINEFKYSLTNFLVDKKQHFEGNLSDSSELITALVTDYTIWDEMVEAVQTNDTEWFDANIPSGLNTYKVNRAWVVGTDYQTRYSAFTEGLSDEPLPVKNLEVNAKDVFKHSYFQSFYAYIDNDWYEVRSAPIQSTADTGRVGTPKGYFFVAHKLDEIYIKRLETINDVKITIETNSRQDIIDNSQAKIVFSRPLIDWQGTPIGALRVTALSKDLLSSYQLFTDLEIFFGINLIILILVIVAYLYLQVTRPIRQLSSSILESDDESLTGLLRRHDEFRDAAELIVLSKQRQRELGAALKLKEKAEVHANEQARAAERMNDLMVGREIKMMDLKKQIRTIRSESKSRGEKHD